MLLTKVTYISTYLLSFLCQRSDFKGEHTLDPEQMICKKGKER